MEQLLTCSAHVHQGIGEQVCVCLDTVARTFSGERNVFTVCFLGKENPDG